MAAKRLRWWIETSFLNFANFKRRRSPWLRYRDMKIPPASGTNQNYFRRFSRAKTMKSDSNPVWYMNWTDGSKRDFREYFPPCYQDREKDRGGLVKILSITFQCKRNRMKTTQHSCPEGPLLTQDRPLLKRLPPTKNPFIPYEPPKRNTKVNLDCDCHVVTIAAWQMD